jgi:hypothetical protein
MADKSNDYVSAVNSVIGLCKDAQEGFRGTTSIRSSKRLNRSVHPTSHVVALELVIQGARCWVDL